MRKGRLREISSPKGMTQAEMLSKFHWLPWLGNLQHGPPLLLTRARDERGGRNSQHCFHGHVPVTTFRLRGDHTLGDEHSENDVGCKIKRSF